MMYLGIFIGWILGIFSVYVVFRAEGIDLNDLYKP